MKSFVSISDFEDDIESYTSYKVQQTDPRAHFFVSAEFSEIRILLSKLPMLFFKNNNCEMHIHNIDRVSKTESKDATIYTLYCLDFSGGRKNTHTYLITCQH